jgi:ABC-type Fe3+ transport system permease subunit
MITKLLFTLLIIIAALITIRYRNSRRQHAAQHDDERRAQQAAERRHAWRVAVALVTLMVLTSAGIYYSHWKAQHRLVTVRVINSLTGGEQSYRLYQGDLDGRSFRTTDGRLISLSDSERMEVREGVE